MTIKILDDAALASATQELIARDPDLRMVHDRYGPPPLWSRPPGFVTLLRIILEQQVSLASALAVFRKLEATCGTLTPEAFLTFTDLELKAMGFSRQKERYGRILAEGVLDGSIRLEDLAELDDHEAKARLIGITGIGHWSADVYLMEALLRPDVWPVGDLALATAVRRLKGLAKNPMAVELERIGEAWRPWRSVAARLVWWDYLEGRTPV